MWGEVRGDCCCKLSSKGHAKGQAVEQQGNAADRSRRECDMRVRRRKADTQTDWRSICRNNNPTADFMISVRQKLFAIQMRSFHATQPCSLMKHKPVSQTCIYSTVQTAGRMANLQNMSLQLVIKMTTDETNNTIVNPPGVQNLDWNEMTDGKRLSKRPCKHTLSAS